MIRAANEVNGKIVEMLGRYQCAAQWERLRSNVLTDLDGQVRPNWVAGTNLFWYVRPTEGGTEYRIVDAESGVEEPAFDHEGLALALSEAADISVRSQCLPISALEVLDDGVTFDCEKRRWCFGQDGTLTDRGAQLPLHWLVSPDKRKAAFIRDYNIWVVNLQTGVETALTTDGVRYFAYAVQTEGRHLAAGLEGDPDAMPLPEAMWSPDSRKVLTVRLDERRVETLPTVLFAPQDGTLRPRVAEIKYALPGDKAVPLYRFVVIDVDSADQTDIDYPPVEDAFIWHGPFSGNRAWWSGDVENVYFLDMSRGQKVVRVVKANAASGVTRLLFEERSETYLEIGHDFETPTAIIPIPQSDELIWFSQRTGLAHLYLYDLKSGRLKNAITDGDYSVRDLLYFDADRREVWLQINGREPSRDFYYREIVRVSIDSGGITTVASSDHDFDARGGVSGGGDFIVSSHGRVDTPTISDLRDRDGRIVMRLAKTKTSELPQGFQWPEPVKTVAEDGRTEIFGAVFKPSAFDATKSYPVLDFCHSNPFYAAVPKRSFTGYFQTAMAFAELGMIVVMLDGRGTSFRDKTFRDYGYREFLENGGVRDRAAGIKQLAESRPYMDLDRVGIIDFDGSNAGVVGLLLLPEFYKVGVASSIYDPRLVKQGEVYMGLINEELRDNAEIWGEAIENLEGKLFIITGLRDRYFHPAGVFRLTDALIKANKDFVHLVQPNGGHAWRVVHGRRRIWDFLTEHLCGAVPPSEFEVKCGLERLAAHQMTERT